MSVVHHNDCFIRVVTYLSSSLYVVFPARAPEGHNSTICGLNDVEVSLGVECGDGRSGPQQAGYQLALLVCTLTIAVLGGIVTGKQVNRKLVIPLLFMSCKSQFIPIIYIQSFTTVHGCIYY